MSDDCLHSVNAILTTSSKSAKRTLMSFSVSVRLEEGEHRNAFGDETVAVRVSSIDSGLVPASIDSEVRVLEGLPVVKGTNPGCSKRI